MSALQAARQSDLEHSGLDQDPVIEGFGVYETHTHTPQTADSNQWFMDRWLTRVSVMSKSHCARTHTCPSTPNSPKLHTSGQGFS